MDFEEGSIWLLVAALAGMVPVLVVGAKKLWKWYQKLQSGSSETLSEHVTRVEKEEE